MLGFKPTTLSFECPPITPRQGLPPATMNCFTRFSPGKLSCQCYMSLQAL